MDSYRIEEREMARAGKEATDRKDDQQRML